MQQQLQQNQDEIKKIEVEYQKVMQGKRSLVEKKSENDMVMTELNLANDGKDTVYKLVGPILAKQDLSEAKVNVKTRLDYIQKEIERMDQLEKDFIAQVNDKNATMGKIKGEYIAMVQKLQA